MYCAKCGKEIEDQGEGGYCKDCELYTASPTFFKPQKHLEEGTQLLYVFCVGLGLFVHVYCLIFGVYEPTQDDLLYVLIGYLLGLIPLALTFLIVVRELKRNVDHSNLMLLGITLLLTNYPLFNLCIRFYQFFFQH